MEEDRVYSGNNNSDIMTLLENSNNSLCVVQPSPTLSFPETMMNFDQEPHKGRRLGIKRDYYDNDDDDDDNGFEEFELNPYQPEKKRRLSPEQVQYLEKSFEMDNKLEPERKLELAKELGLQPRQVAIWFQNRRARYKIKRLEKEYGSLKARYDRLKLAFDSVSKENYTLQIEVKVLTKKLKQRDESITSANLLQHPKMLMPENEIEIETMKKTNNGQLIEQASSTKSDIVDSESPHWTNGNHSDPTDQQSDFSLEEEENLMMNITPPISFLKVEEENGCYDLNGNNNVSSCNFSLVDDQLFGLCFIN